MDRLPGWIDRDSREPTSFPGIVVLAEGQRLPVTMTNISAEGCQVECIEALPIGQTVQLELAGDIKAEASVRWAILGRAGLRFTFPWILDEPLNSSCPS